MESNLDKFDEEWLREAARMEEEAGCDIGAGVRKKGDDCITRVQAEKFEKALEQMSQSSDPEREKNPILWQAQISALESQLSDLREEMKD